MSDLITNLQQMVEQQVSEVNTTMPGTIVAYNKGTNRATVRPVMPKRLANGEDLAPPLIYNVPIHWQATAAGQAFLTFPIAVGDNVMLHFIQRSTEGWLSGNNEGPDDPRMHDLSDAIGIMGLMPTGIQGDDDNVVLKFNNAFIRIHKDGTIAIGNSACTLTFNPDGNVVFHSPLVLNDGDIKAGTISLTTHKHRDVQTGASNTGIPVP